MTVPFAPLCLLGTLMIGPAVAERWRPPELQVRARVPAPTFDALRELALAYLGRPYLMGGVGSPGFDCSGFVCRVYAEAGYAIPRVSRDQALAGAPVDVARLEPGDLLFFVDPPGGKRITHVGIYLGNQELIHASSGDGKVEVASLRASWFRTRLVSARRLLRPLAAAGTSTIATATSTSTGERALPAVTRAPVRELVEHTGAEVLPPTLRLPARRPEPSFGPELAGVGRTSIGLRSALVTENESFGLTLAPEVGVRFESIALAVALAVPVRFEKDQSPTVGTLSSAADWTRFLRSASLGLRGADLDLRLSRLGDATLLDGLVLGRFAPGANARGVPGLMVGRSPLSFFGGVRVEGVEAALVADDVVDPALGGLAVSAPLFSRDLRLGLAGATDQRAMLGNDPPDATARGGAEQGGLRRAISSIEAQATFDLIATSGWWLGAGASGALTGALSRIGAGSEGSLSLERRFDRGASAIRVSARGGWLGPGFLANLFGPTYLSSRRAHLEALRDSRGRGELVGELSFAAGRLTIGAQWAEGIGQDRSALDRRGLLLVEVSDLSLGGTRLAALRVVLASRAPFSEGAAVYAVHGGLQVRFGSWIFGEVYVEGGEHLEGGVGITVAWEL